LAKVGHAPKIFGGGYDTDQDNKHLDADGNVVYGVADDIGRAIYIVDANTGEKLWQAGPAGSDNGSDPDLIISTMTNSIPSDVRLLDSDLDGHTDRLYVGDMHGQIFRIDLQTTDTGFSSSGVRLANLGGTDAANDRRFYYTPDVVIAQQPGAEPYVSINIGSGYRAHPLNPASGTRVNDRFYSLRDPNVRSAAPSDFSAITNSDLFNATNDLNNTAAEVEHGWYITLGNGSGEKVLSSSITLNGEIFFTTYTPPETAENGACTRQLGTGTLYRVSLFDAKPTLINYSADGDVIASVVGDRTTSLVRPGIPSSPTIMFRETFNDDGTSNGVKIIHCEGTECEELPDSIKMEETYWRDEG
jgi:type IV pilus assembly protein PilY1